MKTETSLLITRDDALRQQFERTIGDAEWNWLDSGPFLPLMENASDLEAELSMNAPTLVMIDSAFALGKVDDWEGLRALGLRDLQNVLKDPDTCPPSVRVMRTFAHAKRRLHNQQRMFIWYLVDDPTPVMTQVLLGAGVDWVWTPRQSIKQIPSVVRAVREMDDEERQFRPALLIIENSYEVALELGELCRPWMDVEVVNKDRSEQDFADVDINEALDTFGRGFEGRPFSVVVVDLALRKAREDEAKKWFRDEDHAREWLTTLSGGSPTVSQELLKIFGGLYIIKQIRRRDPLVSIFVVSQFAGTVAVQDLIRRVLGAHVFESLDILFKDGEWEKLLESKVREAAEGAGERGHVKEKESSPKE